MAYPTAYSLSYDFTAFQAANPTTPLPADKLEIEFNNLQTTTDEIIANLALIQRSDGALANESVGIDQLKAEVTTTLNTATNWLTSTSYVANDAVYQSNKVYRCLEAHISNVFATDLAAEKWSELLDFDQFISQTNADAVSTAADAVATAADRVATGNDAAATAADAIATAADAVSTAADVVSADAAAATAVAATGASAFKYTFSSTVTMDDPGAGIVRFNNATIASVTAIAFDATSADSGNPDISDFIATWGASTDTVKGYITFRKEGTPATFVTFSIGAAVTDNTGWLQATVAHVASNGTISDADDLYVSFTRTGDAGTGSLSNVVEDTTPQLGGDLDLNGNQITSPDGTDLIDIPNGSIDLQTASTSRLDITDGGVRLGAANARVTTILDEDAMGSDSATALATQQSIKAYVDAAIAGAGGGATLLGTSTPTAVSTVDFTSIDQTYGALVLSWTGLSCDTATRALLFCSNTGGGLGTDRGMRMDASGGTLTGATTSGFINLNPSVTVGAANTSSGCIVFEGYQSGMVCKYYGFKDNGDGTAQYFSGILTNGSANVVTTALTGLRAYWNSTGNFDAGTITLHGVK